MKLNDTDTSPVTVLIADDHCLVRKGFRKLLEDDPQLQVVGEAGDGIQTVELALQLRPRVIIMDLSMPRLNGLQASREILRQAPSTAILAVSMHTEDHYIRAAIATGARGYVAKDAYGIDLAEAVKAVAADETFTPSLTAALSPGDCGRAKRLTPRELQILRMIAEGKTNKEIAVILSLSVSTVNSHRAALMTVLNVRRTARLVLYAVRNGFADLPF